MSDFTGHWKIDTVEIEHGDGSHAPAKEPGIWLSEQEVEGRLWCDFQFVTQEDGQKTNLPVPIDQDDPYHLVLCPPSGAVGYWLDATYEPAQPAVLKGKICYRRRGAEDLDTATFTATKTT